MVQIRWTRIACVSAAALGFLAGVLIHAAFPFEGTPNAVTIGLAIAAGMTIIIPAKFRWGIVACVAGIAFGLWRFDLTLPAEAEPQSPFMGTVVEEGRYDVLVLDDATGINIKVGKRRWVGERVRVSCKHLQRLDTENARAVFDARKGAWFSCKSPVVARVGEAWRWDPRWMLGMWRTVLSRRIQGILPGDAGALLAGILYGERGLSQSASAAFKTAGMTHLIAVSGSNIAIVISLFVPIFLFLGYYRRPAILLSGGAIVLFTLFVGAQASVVRAALMGWLALLARVFGRKASAARLLMIAAIAIVLFDPWALAFDAGFALSFLATWGLLVWSRPFQNYLGWIPEALGLREAAATTLAATLVTFPYSLWAFGSASLIGLITNLFAVPIGGLAMIWGAVAVALGPLVPVAVLPAEGCLNAMLGIARLSEYLPIRVSWTLPTWGLFLIYIGLFVYSRSMGTKDRLYPHLQPQEVEISPILRGVVSDS